MNCCARRLLHAKDPSSTDVVSIRLEHAKLYRLQCFLEQLKRACDCGPIRQSSPQNPIGLLLLKYLHTFRSGSRVREPASPAGAHQKQPPLDQSSPSQFTRRMAFSRGLLCSFGL